MSSPDADGIVTLPLLDGALASVPFWHICAMIGAIDRQDTTVVLTSGTELAVNLPRHAVVAKLEAACPA